MPPKDEDGFYIGPGTHEMKFIGFIEPKRSEKLSIDKVIYNAPATIVYWSDGTKTVVKCQNCTTRSCKSIQRDNGTCSIEYIEKWQHDGLMYAALKKTFPNYLDEFKRVLGY